MKFLKLKTYILPFILLLLFSMTAFGNDRLQSAHFEGGTITIPRIDIDTKAAYFRDVIFQYDEHQGWSLQDYKRIGENLLNPVPLETVELVISESIPVQVFLKVTSKTVPGCVWVKPVYQRFKNNRFEVEIYMDDLDPMTSCFFSTEIEKVIPLSVYGLGTGNYEYIINGQTSGSFTLEQDNVLQ